MAGIRPAELHRRVKAKTSPIPVDELLGWLVAGGLALEQDGRLVPTERGIALGAGLSSPG
jgi:hypothetical protein